MGNKDKTQKLFVACRDVFAEIVNVLLYHGEKVLCEEVLLPGPTESIYPGQAAELAGQFQDYSMYEVVWGEVHALYALENQNCVDYWMALRCAGYEGAAYRRQYGQREPEGKRTPGERHLGERLPGEEPSKAKLLQEKLMEKKQPGERLTQEKLSERKQLGENPSEGNPSKENPSGRQGIYPVISMVLNWGEKRWTAATAIRDLIDYPVHEAAEDYLDRNRMHVFDMRFLDETVRNLFEGDVRVVLDYLSDRESLIRRRQRLRNPEEVMRMLHALSGDTRYLDNIMFMEEGGMAVCDLLDEMVNKGIAQGMEKGIQQGIQKGIQQGMHQGIQKGVQQGIQALITTCREFGATFAETSAKLKEKFSLDDAEVQKDMALYWWGRCERSDSVWDSGMGRIISFFGQLVIWQMLLLLYNPVC